jgi:hypothetical protein
MRIGDWIKANDNLSYRMGGAIMRINEITPEGHYVVLDGQKILPQYVKQASKWKLGDKVDGGAFQREKSCRM